MTAPIWRTPVFKASEKWPMKQTEKAEKRAEIILSGMPRQDIKGRR